MTNIPRYDFYQTPTQIILSLYVKGFNAPGLVDQVRVIFEEGSVDVSLPALHDEDSTSQFKLTPLENRIIPNESTFRVLGSKIECKLAKQEPITWKGIVPSSQQPTNSSSKDASDNIQASSSSSSIPTKNVEYPAPAAKEEGAGNVATKAKPRKNWDKMIDEELGDDSKATKADPNAGGDAALQELFSSIYAGADADTKRAMIKSFTESGGTTLSTDWSSISKESTPVRPPEGMYPFKP